MKKRSIIIGVMALFATACTPAAETDPQPSDTPDETDAPTIVLLDPETQSVREFVAHGETQPVSPSDDEAPISVAEYLEDAPGQVQCWRYHATDSETGTEGCGVSCADGQNYPMDCDAEIFESGFEIDHTE